VTIKLWDLAGAEDDRRFSPYCWRVKMALRHKGLEAEEIPWRLTEKDAIAFSGQKLVPVSGDEAHTLTYFFKHWVERNIHSGVMKVIIVDPFNQLHEKDRAYFHASREKRFGKTLEQFGAARAPGQADYILFGGYARQAKGFPVWA
jgi:hypothetical protein